MAYNPYSERTQYERGRAEGLSVGQLEGFRGIVVLGLDRKLGPAGTALLPEIMPIADVDLLRAIVARLKTATTLDEVRAVYARA